MINALRKQTTLAPDLRVRGTVMSFAGLGTELGTELGNTATL
jgi:hypothetical protein